MEISNAGRHASHSPRGQGGGGEEGECWSGRWKGTGVFVDMRHAPEEPSAPGMDTPEAETGGGIERKVKRARVWVAK